MTLPKHTAAFLILTAHFIIGLFVYADYGISWDEEFQHDYGKTVYEYVFEGSDTLHIHNSRYHGPAVQFFMYSLERGLEISDPKDLFQLRHLITFLISVFGLWFLYRLLLLLRFSPNWAAFGMLTMIVSPRIYAHAFYNSKDIVFMYLFVVAVYTMVRFLRKPTLTNALWHGFACGFLVDVRILGLFVPMFTGIFLLRELVSDRTQWKTYWRPVLLSLVVGLITIYIFWPTLWHAADWEFRAAIRHMSKYPWDDYVLFDGAFIAASVVPWYYLPKWFVITTPPVLLAFLIIGLLAWPLEYRLPPSEKWLPILWVLLPLGIIIGKSATVYDSWRHVFFLYPALVILMVHGARSLFDRPGMRLLRWAPFLLLLVPMAQMVRMHPFQQVYFNTFAGEEPWKRYEMDYWGLSYRQAFEWLVREYPEGELTVSVANAPGFYNHWMLPRVERERITFVEFGKADFFISNFRYPREHDNFIAKKDAYGRALHIIEVRGNPLVGVFDKSRNER